MDPSPLPAAAASLPATAAEEELEAIVELPRLDELDGELVSWCDDTAWIDGEDGGYAAAAAAAHDDMFGFGFGAVDGDQHGWAQSVGALLWNM
uniref:Uncharacterized protein n=1 Tax=Leersia perrieri TaxID=77586 RepID=A0A0D9VE21_9ORYZ